MCLERDVIAILSVILYHQFAMALIKFVLHEYNISFIHIKIVGDLLIIGVTSENIQHYNDEQLPQDRFNRQHYRLYKHKYQQQS